MNKVLRIPIFNLGKGFYRIGKAPYSVPEFIPQKGDKQLLKQEAAGDYIELKYTFLDKQDQELAYLRGFITNKTNFNIKRIRSTSKENGLKLNELWKPIEEDLKKSGIEKVFSRAYPKIVPLTKRIGFKLLKNKIFNRPKKNGSLFARIVDKIIPPYIYQIEKDLK